MRTWAAWGSQGRLSSPVIDHSDHIGCTPAILGTFPLQVAAYDRGGSSGTPEYAAYATAAGARRRTALKGQTITLDGGSAHPITITFVAVNADGAATTDEHDLGLVAAVRFGQFDAVFGGDVSGVANGTSLVDVESAVATIVGTVEVYKVHQHGGRFASNAGWLSALTPKVGVISVANNSGQALPAVETLARLHAASVTTYWTSAGDGPPPVTGRDVVAGDIVIDVEPGATAFTVRYGTSADVYAVWGAPLPGAGLPSTPPFGSFDTPTAGGTLTGEVGVTGWALDNSGVTGVDIYRTPLPGEPVQSNGLVFIGTASRVRGARPDVATTYSAYPQADSAGWGYMLLSNMLPNQGNGTFTLWASTSARRMVRTRRLDRRPSRSSTRPAPLHSARLTRPRRGRPLAGRSSIGAGR